MEHSRAAIGTNSSSNEQPLNDQVSLESQETSTQDTELTEEIAEHGPVAPPWLRGSSWEGRPFPKNARLNFALAIRKEAHFRRKLARSISDEQMAVRVEEKAQAVSTAARHLKSAGFFGGTRTPEMWQDACHEWNSALQLPGAEPTSAIHTKASSELIICNDEM